MLAFLSLSHLPLFQNSYLIFKRNKHQMQSHWKTRRKKNAKWPLPLSSSLSVPHRLNRQTLCSLRHTQRIAPQKLLRKRRRVYAAAAAAVVASSQRGLRTFDLAEQKVSSWIYFARIIGTVLFDSCLTIFFVRNYRKIVILFCLCVWINELVKR